MAQVSDGQSWASHAERASLRRLEKNVMEIILEKDVRGVFDVNDNEVAKLLQKLGVSLQSQVEMVQICPLGRNTIQVTLKNNVSMDKFFNRESFEVKAGVRVSHVRAAGQREVTVLVKGLHPQTSDATVIKYLRCMGKVEKTKVILETFNDGPLKGLQNGDRRYTVEFYPNVNVGTLHIVDGQRVTLSFPGQKRSCYRCLKVSQQCPGHGVAKECEAAGGQRQLLINHMQEFWKSIGYECDTVKDMENFSDDREIIEQQVGGQFTPAKEVPSGKSANNYSGVTVKWFPKKSDHGDILDFLVKFGLPEDHNAINIKDNGQVVIENLDPVICDQLCSSLNGLKFQNKRNIYCHGIVAVTPEKQNVSNAASVEVDPEKSSSSASGSSSKTVICTEKNDSLKDFDFCELNQSKFFKKPTEVESEDQNDNYESDYEDWSIQNKNKKRKTMLHLQTITKNKIGRRPLK